MPRKYDRVNNLNLYKWSARSERCVLFIYAIDWSISRATAQVRSHFEGHLFDLEIGTALEKEPKKIDNIFGGIKCWIDEVIFTPPT